MDPGDQTAFNAAKKRLPWLIILLFLGLITASLIGRFEETLDQVAVLAIFIPLIAGMAGNSGTQALAVTVRGLATGEISKEGFFKRLRRETLTGFITGITCGLLMFLIHSCMDESFIPWCHCRCFDCCISFSCYDSRFVDAIIDA